MLVPLACLVVGACADATGPTHRSTLPGDAYLAQVIARDNVVLPLSQVFQNSCTGEDVLVTGDLHLVTMTTAFPDGSIVDVFHTNFQGTTGLGLSTGTIYRATSAENAPFKGLFPRGPWRSTHEGTLHLVAPGKASDLLWHFVFVVTREPGSPPTAIVSRTGVTCT
jgi:hypothetical protein